MYVRVLTGRYEGEVRDIEPASAQVMLKDGRGENPFAEVEAPAIAVQILEVVRSSRPKGKTLIGAPIR